MKNYKKVLEDNNYEYEVYENEDCTDRSVYDDGYIHVTRDNTRYAVWVGEGTDKQNERMRLKVDTLMS